MKYKIITLIISIIGVLLVIYFGYIPYKQSNWKDERESYLIEYNSEIKKFDEVINSYQANDSIRENIELIKMHYECYNNEILTYYSFPFTWSAEKNISRFKEEQQKYIDQRSNY